MGSVRRWRAIELHGPAAAEEGEGAAVAVVVVESVPVASAEAVADQAVLTRPLRADTT